MACRLVRPQSRIASIYTVKFESLVILLPNLTLIDSMTRRSACRSGIRCGIDQNSFNGVMPWRRDGIRRLSTDMTLEATLRLEDMH